MLMCCRMRPFNKFRTGINGLPVRRTCLPCLRRPACATRRQATRQAGVPTAQVDADRRNYKFPPKIEHNYANNLDNPLP